MFITLVYLVTMLQYIFIYNRIRGVDGEQLGPFYRPTYPISGYRSCNAVAIVFSTALSVSVTRSTAI